MTTFPTVLAAFFALVVFLFVANGVLVHYSKGVARTAVDEAARVAAVYGGDPDVCAEIAGATLRDLLGGPLGRDLTVECGYVDGVVSATVRGELPPILRPFPSYEVAVSASAVVDG